MSEKQTGGPVAAAPVASPPPPAPAPATPAAPPMDVIAPEPAPAPVAPKVVGVTGTELTNNLLRFAFGWLFDRLAKGVPAWMAEYILAFKEKFLSEILQQAAVVLGATGGVVAQAPVQLKDWLTDLLVKLKARVRPSLKVPVGLLLRFLPYLVDELWDAIAEYAEVGAAFGITKLAETFDAHDRGLDVSVPTAFRLEGTVQVANAAYMTETELTQEIFKTIIQSIES